MKFWLYGCVTGKKLLDSAADTDDNADTGILHEICYLLQDRSSCRPRNFAENSTGYRRILMKFLSGVMGYLTSKKPFYYGHIRITIRIQDIYHNLPRDAVDRCPTLHLSGCRSVTFVYGI